MSAAGGLLLAIILVVVLAGSRRQALIAIVCGVLYLAQHQQLALFGVSLFPSRFLELAGFVRVMSRREFSFSNLNSVDRALLWLYGYCAVVFLLRSREGIGSNVAMSLDAILCYFTFRGLLRGLDDLRWLLVTMVLVLVPFMVLLMIERKTGRIPLPFMAGSAGFGGGFMREGVPRCFGSFRNMDLLGTFGASFLPLYIGLVLAKVNRSRAIIGVIFCVAIVIFSNSGGPIGSAAVAVIGWGLWYGRSQMRLFRWALLAGFALLALVMKAPVWYILARASSITGGAGWHRSYLIDVAVRHLDSWWLAGIPIADTKPWFPYILGTTGGADITNQYLLFGITAGLGAMALLIYMVTRAFSDLGKALAYVRSPAIRHKPTEFMLFGLGIMLAVHLVNWLGITYYDQTYVVWFLQLSAIATISNGLIRAGRSGFAAGSRTRPVNLGVSGVELGSAGPSSNQPSKGGSEATVHSAGPTDNRQLT